MKTVKTVQVNTFSFPEIMFQYPSKMFDYRRFNNTIMFDYSRMFPSFQEPSLEEDTSEILNRIETLKNNSSCPDLNWSYFDFNHSKVTSYLTNTSSYYRLNESFNGKPVISVYDPVFYNDLFPPTHYTDDISHWDVHRSNLRDFNSFLYTAFKAKQQYIFDSNIGLEPMLLETTITNNFFQVNRNNPFIAIPRSKQKAVIPKSYCTAFNNFHFDKTDLTTAKLVKSPGAVTAVLIPLTIRTSENPDVAEDVYFYTFSINSNYKKIAKYKKAIKYFTTYLDSFVNHSGLFYKDLKAFNFLLYENPYGRFLNKETKAFYDDKLINPSVQDYFNKKNNIAAAVPFNLVEPVISKKSLPESLLKKQSKINKKIDRDSSFCNTNLIAPSVTFKEAISQNFNSKHELKFSKNRIASLQEKIDLAQIELAKYKAQIDSYNSAISNRTRDLNNLILTAKSHSNLKVANMRVLKTLTLQQLEIFETLDYEIPLSEKNILQNYSVTKLVLKSKNKDKQLTINKDTSLSEVLSFIKTPDWFFHQVDFFTKAPSKIKLNGTNKNPIVGGPYFVELTQTGLKLSLTSVASYIGVINSTQLVYHPHAGTRSTLTLSSSACLGEAASLIYNAFETKRLSQIIMSANIWLTSANTADVWGRRAKYFSSWEDHQKYLNFKQQDIEQDIEDLPIQEIQDLEVEDSILPETLTIESTLPSPGSGDSQTQELNSNTNNQYNPYFSRSQ
jgi:hypothetical protein